MKDIPIENALPFAMTLTFAFAAVLFTTPDGALGHVLLAASVLLVGFFLFATGFVGAGAVKFFAASSLWIGPNQAFLSFAAISLIGSAVLAIVLIRIRGRTASVPVLPAMLFALVLALPQAPIWQVLMA